MSAADRMVVRTRDGSYRSFPRRTALGMISRGQATAATAAAAPAVDPAPAAVDPLGPHGDEYQEKRAQFLTDMAAALDVPVEVLTPIEDGVYHWSAADDSAEMAAALGIIDTPAERRGPHGDEYVIPTKIGPPADVVLTDEPIEIDLYRFEGSDVAPGEAINLDTGEVTAAGEPLPPVPSEPRGNASRAEWAVYAARLGVEVSDGMTRNQIRDAAQDVAQSLDRLPQPALTGGRLDTPEDEPVTEESVTDDEDPGKP